MGIQTLGTLGWKLELGVELQLGLGWGIEIGFWNWVGNMCTEFVQDVTETGSKLLKTVQSVEDQKESHVG